MPTHTHVFGSHRNGYGHLKTADVRSLVDRRKSDSSTILKLGFDFRIDEDYDFEDCRFAYWIRRLDDMHTRPNRPHQNKRKQFTTANHSDMVANDLNVVSNVLTQVSVPTKDESELSTTFTHTLKGSSTYVPTHAPSRPALSCLLEYPTTKHKNQNNLINNKRRRPQALIVLLNSQTTK